MTTPADDRAEKARKALEDYAMIMLAETKELRRKLLAEKGNVLARLREITDATATNKSP